MSKEIPNLRALLNAKQIKPSQLAKALKVDRSRITRWSQTKVPAERCLAIEAITGIPRDMMRPDVYLAAPEPKAKGKRPIKEAAE